MRRLEEDMLYRKRGQATLSLEVGVINPNDRNSLKNEPA